jgi:hypothetical protein
MGPARARCPDQRPGGRRSLSWSRPADPPTPVLPLDVSIVLASNPLRCARTRLHPAGPGVPPPAGSADAHPDTRAGSPQRQKTRFCAASRQRSATAELVQIESSLLSALSSGPPGFLRRWLGWRDSRRERRRGHRCEPAFGRGTAQDRPVRVAVSAARLRAGSSDAGPDCGEFRTRAGSVADGPGSRRGCGPGARGGIPRSNVRQWHSCGGVRTLHSTVRIPASARTASNAVVKLEPRSRIMNLTLPAWSPRSMRRLRACWAVQSPVG